MALEQFITSAVISCVLTKNVYSTTAGWIAFNYHSRVTLCLEFTPRSPCNDCGWTNGTRTVYPRAQWIELLEQYFIMYKYKWHRTNIQTLQVKLHIQHQCHTLLTSSSQADIHSTLSLLMDVVALIGCSDTKIISREIPELTSAFAITDWR